MPGTSNSLKQPVTEPVIDPVTEPENERYTFLQSSVIN